MTQVSITLRKATEQDVSILSDIGINSYCHHFAALWNNQDELLDYLDQEYSPVKIINDINQQNIEWYLIEHSSPIGLVKLTHQSSIPESSITGTLLNKLYFSPDVTGKGYGMIVFRLIENIAKQSGSTALWLDVLASNARAIKLYQSNGLHILKEVLFKSKTQQTLEYIMSKTL
ncbi:MULTISPECIES: GNAT family N-acetyltransferase [Providencia]|uniref:GNAT family N-acetyltransferase n=1 Tax=Providencia TaxID=586 RepID=UPI0008FBB5F9|nr:MULTISPECIES: GNAT family N-acetyltransferase [Providencia]APC11888.1 ribosomal-protein-alanine N-acetyltransferase [Providencia rettgeri]AVL75213.1 N-acetyltransferase [Providencia rettgeri]EKH6495016.1 GNAT family N-acetyltransferase [Providencia rettgeri]ELR5051775.1 GNAT family N-acetyltransferase [Providencia rettgeri]ELR5153678.1 GNAT family N-acetyltransferase [Providencia rettgeri]